MVQEKGIVCRSEGVTPFGHDENENEDQASQTLAQALK
jgi:hypothetical protein